MQSTKPSVDSLFIQQSQLGRESFQAALYASIDSLLAEWQTSRGPYSGILPGKLATHVESLFQIQPAGESIESVFQDIKITFYRIWLMCHILNAWHICIAHLLSLLWRQR